MIGAPSELKALAPRLDDAALLRLVEAYGGVRLYVPHKPAGTELETALGADVARRLSMELGGQTVRIPLVRYWRIQVYRDQGQTYTAIARRLGITDAAVWRVLKQAARTQGRGSEPEQLSLLPS